MLTSGGGDCGAAPIGRLFPPRRALNCQNRRRHAAEHCMAQPWLASPGQRPRPLPSAHPSPPLPCPALQERNTTSCEIVGAVPTTISYSTGASAECLCAQDPFFKNTAQVGGWPGWSGAAWKTGLCMLAGRSVAAGCACQVCATCPHTTGKHSTAHCSSASPHALAPLPTSAVPAVQVPQGNCRGSGGGH